MLLFPPTPCSPINQRVLRSRQGGDKKQEKRKRSATEEQGEEKSLRASKKAERVKGNKEVKNGRKAKKGKTKTASAQIKGYLSGVENGGDGGEDIKDAVVTKSETGKVEPIGKIHLIQGERVKSRTADSRMGKRMDERVRGQGKGFWELELIYRKSSP